MATVLIGLDDTDNETSRGTGHLARRLLAQCRQRGGSDAGVTRHQFLLDDRIPYTSHNSGACIGVESEAGPEAFAFAYDFVREESAEGSDPGVCVCDPENISAAVLEFGNRATREILEMAEALDLARREGLDLRPLGGSGLGVIGALGAVALRCGGEEGRFIDMPGLRDLPDRVKVLDVQRLGIHLIHRGREPKPTEACDTLGWIRPNLRDGRPVLPVEWNEEHDAWTPVDRKHSHPPA